MKIIPKRGLNIGTGTAPIHAPAGVPVDVSDKLGRDLLSMDAASRAPVEVAAPAHPVPIIETAALAPAPENAAWPARKSRR